jgi:hypothetical protein
VASRSARGLFAKVELLLGLVSEEGLAP